MNEGRDNENSIYFLKIYNLHGSIFFKKSITARDYVCLLEQTSNE